MQWLILRIRALTVCYPLDEIAVIRHVVLLWHVHLVLVVVSPVFFFFSDYVFVIFKQLTCFIFRSRVSLVWVLGVLIVLISVLWSWLCPIWNHLLYIYYAIVGLGLANHWSHHTLGEIVRLWYLVLNNGLRIVLLVEIGGYVCLVGIVASPWATSRSRSLKAFPTELPNLRNWTKSLPTSLSRDVLLRLLLLYILLGELVLLDYVLLGRVAWVGHDHCLISIQIAVYVIATKHFHVLAGDVLGGLRMHNLLGILTC